MQKTNLFLSRILPKINVGLVSVISGCVLASNAIAAINCSIASCAAGSTETNLISCEKPAQPFAVGGVCIATCGNDEAACYDNYHLVTKTISVSGCGDYSYTTCEEDEDIDDGDDTGGDTGDNDFSGQIECFLLKAVCFGDDESAYPAISNCVTDTMSCLGSTSFRTCITCDEGYDKIPSIVTDSACTNTATKYTCGIKCSTDDDCASLTTDWSVGTNGLQTRSTGSCNALLGTCAIKDTSKCASGYYANRTPVLLAGHCSKCEAGYYCPDGTSKLSCAEKTGDSPATSLAGSDDISDCYVPANKTYQNSTGQFEFSMDCYYKQ